MTKQAEETKTEKPEPPKDEPKLELIRFASAGAVRRVR